MGKVVDWMQWLSGEWWEADRDRDFVAVARSKLLTLK